MGKIIFRADASYEIGIGHFMRCLTLAQELNINKEHDIIFIYRKTDGYLEESIKSAGFKCIELKKGIDHPLSNLHHGHWLRATQEEDADEFRAVLKEHNIDSVDLIVVDHYGIDHLWHSQVRNITKKIFVIDDLGDRFLNCDYLLDQTFGCDVNKYSKLVNRNCKKFLGTKYALLRQEFQGLTSTERKNESLLVMFGGTDPDNLTLRALKVIDSINITRPVSVIMNTGSKHLQSIIDYCHSRKSFFLHVSPSNVAKLMSESILAIGAAGTTSWERCAAGLPAVVIIQAFNQREIASNLQKKGVISYIEAEHIEKELENQINAWIKLLSNENHIKEICLDICDGYGAPRIAREIIND